MRVSELFDAKTIANVYTEVASNKIAPLGEGLFPSTKQMGLDLKEIRGVKGLPVALQASAYDTVSTIRSREGIKVSEKELAYFKESMLLKEKDEVDIMRLVDANDPYAKDVVNRIYDDETTLIEGAEVIPEIMRMQLLSSANGNPSISIASDGATYAYNYDPDNEYKNNNFVKLTGTDVWSDTVNSDPIADMEAGMDAVEDASGARPSIALMSKTTFGWLKKNDKVKNAILATNVLAVPNITDALVKNYIADTLGLTVVIYNKKYKNYNGVATQFYPDGMCTLLPEGALGKTVFGSTPEERTSYQVNDANVAMVNGKIAVTVSTTSDPVQTKTTVSEAVLPSFDRIMETYTMNVNNI